MAQLFRDIYNANPAKREQLAPHKARYPKLHPAERALLTTFFEEVCVKADCSFQQWERYVTSISQDILNTAWMISTVLERMTSRLRWTQLPIYNQWSEKSTGA